MTYTLKNPIRIISAASLFDGHDVSINIIRRVLQDMGCEVIHLGHNRSVEEIVRAALQESAQGICISSYQGGHMEYFKYARALLNQAGAHYVQIFGGGGGVIISEEKTDLEHHGINQIFHSEDGRRLGLLGMVELVVQGCDFDVLERSKNVPAQKLELSEYEKSIAKELRDQLIYERLLGLQISAMENNAHDILKDYQVEFLQIKEKLSLQRQNKELKSHLEGGHKQALNKQDSKTQSKKGSLEKHTPILGITGTGGAGKSSLIDEILQRWTYLFKDLRVGVFCVDPTKRKTGGGLLGDRIRMNSLESYSIYMRSLASRGSGSEISKSLPKILDFAKDLGEFDLIIAETSGIGQADGAITEISDFSLYVMTSEFGAQSQLEKIDMIDLADFIAINKADHKGSLDALRDVRKQYRRSRKIFNEGKDEDLPVYLTQASQFNDEGVNQLFFGIVEKISEIKSENNSGVNTNIQISEEQKHKLRSTKKQLIIPSERKNYLSQIVQSIRSYKKSAQDKSEVASELYALRKTKALLNGSEKSLDKIYEDKSKTLLVEDLKCLENWDEFEERYSKEEYTYMVRGKEVRQPLVKRSLSDLPIRRVAFPKHRDWGERYKFLKLENVPGSFPFTAGVFPLKRTGEDPKRQFAGEGSPERTNKRFHYLSKDDEAKRLSVAFDSVTLYGEDPHLRPDIYGKVGESGVSICNLEDMKKLLKGFDLCSSKTSVSMTINGPAPMILAFFMNTAIDQQIEKKEKELSRELSEEECQKIFDETLQQVRGTVQADILKEDQAQNTCIFSTDFALKMMGDIQDYFIKKSVKNFYSVSISGYHIAEAGANPISQLAFTLSNGFTLLEYYLARGMKVDEFAHNLSFFFSNGLDPEYSVLGRVARRIWAIALRDLYGANERSQKLKYHIQTSGRSLHAQEIAFNDIRTTLQALIAIYDNCNSLHTNAYDEAITTPTEESVRRAMAIQMIINKEFGPAINENSMQGSYFFEELTDMVEEAVLEEFLKINERGGVLGAMETQYQRGKIQAESFYYETLKHSGKLPIIGVNTYIDPETLKSDYKPPKIELARSTPEEKKNQLDHLNSFKKTHGKDSEKHLEDLKNAALKGENIFEALMISARHCSLGQMTRALYEVGGKYRRSI